MSSDSNRVDIAAILKVWRHRPELTYAVVPVAEGVTAADLWTPVNSAIARANRTAMARVPEDPTTSEPAAATPDGLVAIIEDGPMTRAELTAWFTDLDTALGDLAVTVGPHRPQVKVPSFWFGEYDAAPSAFLFFPGTDTVPPSLLPELIPEIASTAAAWVNDDPTLEWTIARRGLSDFVTTPDALAADFERTWANDPQQDMIRITLKPRRMRFFRTVHVPTARLQAYDTAKDRTDAYEATLDGLRRFGGFLDYGCIRLAHAENPSLTWTRPLRREPTEAESIGENGSVRLPLPWERHVGGAFVAQVLNPHHQASIDLSQLDGFTTEPLPNGRILVHAENPTPWINEPNPDPAVYDPAQAVFEPNVWTRGT